MSREAISEIREAEKKAQKIRDDAAENASLMIADAEKKARLMKDEVESKTKAELEVTLDTMRRKADELISKSLSEADADTQAIESVGNAHMRSAVKKIVWEIIEA